MWMSLRATYALTSGLLLVGCAYQPAGAPENFPHAILDGSITANGEPLDEGWISVFPVGSTVGDPAYGRIVAGGYRIDDAPVGSLQVRIDVPRSTREALADNRPLTARLRRISIPSSPLRVTTKRDQATTFDFDVLMSPLESSKAR